MAYYTELPVVPEEAMQRVLSMKNLHPSWVAPLLRAYSDGYVRYEDNTVCAYFLGAEGPHYQLLVTAKNYVLHPFNKPYKELYRVPDATI